MQSRPIPFPNLLVDIYALEFDSSAMSVVVAAESAYSFRLLTQLLVKYITAPVENVFPLLRQFLTDRWQRIQRTDSLYTCHPYTRINQACLLVAKLLSEHLQPSVHPYQLLMPTIPQLMAYFPTYRSSTLMLHEFIIRDDGTPLLLVEAFSLLRKNNPAHRLTLFEETMLRNSSAQARNYYDAINSNQSSVEVREAGEVFEKYLESSTLPYYPELIYGIAGQQQLLKSLIEPIKKREELLTLFAYDIPRIHWHGFLSLIPNESFFKILFGITCLKGSEDLETFNRRLCREVNAKWSVVISKLGEDSTDFVFLIKNFGDRVKMLRAGHAYLVCLLEAYQRIRASEPSTSLINKFTFTNLFSEVAADVNKSNSHAEIYQRIHKIMLEAPDFFSIPALLTAEQGVLGAYLGRITDARITEFVEAVKLLVNAFIKRSNIMRFPTSYQHEEQLTARPH